jgi:hypothetical protein
MKGKLFQDETEGTIFSSREETRRERKQTLHLDRQNSITMNITFLVSWGFC